MQESKYDIHQAQSKGTSCECDRTPLPLAAVPFVAPCQPEGVVAECRIHTTVQCSILHEQPAVRYPETSHVHRAAYCAILVQTSRCTVDFRFRAMSSQQPVSRMSIPR